MGPRISKLSVYRPNIESSSTEEYYRKTLYIPFLDFVISQIKQRFSDKSKIAALFEILLPSYCHKIGIQTDKFKDLLDEFSQALASNNINFTQVKSECHYIKWVKKWQAEFDVKTSPSNFVEALKMCDPCVFPCVSYLLEIASLLPVSTATVERSFSTL